MIQGYLLDTGVANQLSRGDAAIQRKVAAVAAFYVPSIVLAELYYGACWHAHLHQSVKYLDLCSAFLQAHEQRILQCTTDTSFIYGALFAELRAAGKTMQQNDVWIASLARQYGLTLATLDHDFERVSGIAIEFW
ncbi:MAG TPA: PIN domain-containing protein [Ktedonobacterales bacterium]|nr:PIN domain-containing protein [Ktedonobacterales bacterium]